MKDLFLQKIKESISSLGKIEIRVGLDTYYTWRLARGYIYMYISTPKSVHISQLKTIDMFFQELEQVIEMNITYGKIKNLEGEKEEFHFT